MSGTEVPNVNAYNVWLGISSCQMLSRRNVDFSWYDFAERLSLYLVRILHVKANAHNTSVGHTTPPRSQIILNTHSR